MSEGVIVQTPVGRVNSHHVGYDILDGDYVPIYDFSSGPREGSPAASLNWEFDRPFRDSYNPFAPPQAATPVDVAANLRAGGWLPWLSLYTFNEADYLHYAAPSATDYFSIPILSRNVRLAAYQWTLMSHATSNWRSDIPAGYEGYTFNTRYPTVYDVYGDTTSTPEASIMRDAILAETSGSSLAVICVDVSGSYGMTSDHDEFANVVVPVANAVDDVLVVIFAGWGTDTTYSSYNFDGSLLTFDFQGIGYRDYLTQIFDRSAMTAWTGAGGDLPTGSEWDALIPMWTGGDTPETHLDAIRHGIGWAAATGRSWDTKHMIVFTDNNWKAPVAQPYGATPPLRQNQRDNIRQGQRTSRQLTVRQVGYL